MERKIGEIFEYNGEWYQCLKSASCGECDFSNDNCEEREKITLKNKLTKEEITGLCSSKSRDDSKSVIFKKLEKVGKPYNVGKKVFQRYEAFVKPYICNAEVFTINTLDDSYVSIEIKQNKEDMEVKEYDRASVKAVLQAQKELSAAVNKLNLKPFSLEAAKAGKPVCTRDGRKARIICFDAKGDKPIIALVEMGTAETPNNYPIDGKAVSAKEASCDLMMLPEKKEGWVNVYRDNFGLNCSTVYDNKDIALSRIDRNEEDTVYIDTVKISWEE